MVFPKSLHHKFKLKSLININTCSCFDLKAANENLWINTGTF